MIECELVKHFKTWSVLGGMWVFCIDVCVLIVNIDPSFLPAFECAGMGFIDIFQVC